MSLTSSSSPLSAADCVAGSGSVLLRSSWVPADPRYRNESGSAVPWPAGSQGPLKGLLWGRFAFSGITLDVQQHREDGIKHVLELCPTGMSSMLGIEETRSCWAGGAGGSWHGAQLPPAVEEAGGWKRRGQRQFEGIWKGVALLQAECAR